MLGYFDLRRGVRFIYEGEPWEVLDFSQMKKAQREGIAQVKMRSMVSGKVIECGFHSSDSFKEADLQKLKAKYLYRHNGKFFFCQEDNPKNRFELTEEQIGSAARFLKQGVVSEALIFEEKIISVSSPVKIQLKVTEAPPGIRGDRAQGGVKAVVLETGAQINVPLFVETDDIIEINTETGEYTRRVE
ncbi:MAG: elongation factor P [bacterium]|nr:elongation factor P [bacterium]